MFSALKISTSNLINCATLRNYLVVTHTSISTAPPPYLEKLVQTLIQNSKQYQPAGNKNNNPLVLQWSHYLDLELRATVTRLTVTVTLQN